jgi:hypothetical protein
MRTRTAHTLGKNADLVAVVILAVVESVRLGICFVALLLRTHPVHALVELASPFAQWVALVVGFRNGIDLFVESQKKSRDREKKSRDRDML